ncbi:hypothetical protein K438DRAFT_1787517 [Mycena galopus ATCC 62051]|nr:hypothetical protein K438DRAFT_1787517 [Mycena galopus ATCC 62051]
MPSPAVVAFSPLDEALFNSLAPSSKDIRNHRKAIIMLCSGCGKTDGDLGQPLRKCAKVSRQPSARRLICFSVPSSARPTHKKMCGGEGVLKLVKTMMSNPVLYTQTRRDEMLLARVDIAVEPANIDDFEDMLMRNGPTKKNVTGMLQVNALTASADPRWFVHGRRELWRGQRALADSAGFHADAVVIMDIIPTDAQMSITIPLRIPKDVLTVWTSEGAGFTNISSDIGSTTNPFINAHIRTDTHNQLLLRTKMRAADIQVIRDTANYKDSNGSLAETLHAKIAREAVYRKLYQKFVERRKAVTGREQDNILGILDNVVFLAFHSAPSSAFSLSLSSGQPSPASSTDGKTAPPPREGRCKSAWPAWKQWSAWLQDYSFNLGRVEILFCELLKLNSVGSVIGSALFHSLLSRMNEPSRLVKAAHSLVVSISSPWHFVDLLQMWYFVGVER